MTLCHVLEAVVHLLALLDELRDQALEVLLSYLLTQGTPQLRDLLLVGGGRLAVQVLVRPSEVFL